MSEQSSDEVRKQFESTYPGRTGKLAFRLWNDLCVLHTDYAAYLQLYARPSVVATLNGTVPLFFAWVQRWLRANIFIQIGRLTDPPETGARDNASLRALERDLRLEGASMAADALSAHLIPLQPMEARIRKIRHRTIAHSDRKSALREDSPLPTVSRQDLEAFVDGLGNAFNAVDVLFRNSKTYFKGTDMLTGADELLAYLEQGHAAFEAERLRVLGRGNE